MNHKGGSEEMLKAVGNLCILVRQNVRLENIVLRLLWDKTSFAVAVLENWYAVMVKT